MTPRPGPHSQPLTVDPLWRFGAFMLLGGWLEGQVAWYVALPGALFLLWPVRGQ